MRLHNPLLIVVFVQCLIYCASSSRRHASRELVEEEIAKKSKSDNGIVAKPYQFGYQIKDKDGNVQHRHEESDEKGVRRGSYGYLDANGVYRKVQYIADKNGFRVMEMKSNEPGLDPAAKAADVSKSREPDTSNTSPAVLQSHVHPIKLMVHDRDLNNRLVRQSFKAKMQEDGRREKAALTGNFIDNPSYKKQTESRSLQNDVPEDPIIVPDHHPSAIPYFPDLKSVPSSFPYQFEKYHPHSPSQEYNHNLVQSSHSVPIYHAVKGRLQPDPYQKPLPAYAYRPSSSSESNKTQSQSDRNAAKNNYNYYLPLYNPPPISRQPEPSSTYPPYFESSRLSHEREIATQRPVTTTSGYLHPLQPVIPIRSHPRPYDATTQSPYPYYSPKVANSIPDSPSYQHKSRYPPENPGSQLPYPPYISNYVPPRTTMKPYVSYSAPDVSPESPHSSSSRDRPLQYLDGPGPGAIVRSNRMEPSVFYTDEPTYDSERLANEVFSYAPHRTGPETPPPPDNSDQSSGPPPPYGPYGPGPEYGNEALPQMMGMPPAESTRQKLASYYESVRKSAPAVVAKDDSGDSLPSVLLGIQSALGVETGVRLQPSSSSSSSSSDTSEPDSNYTPSHYPSQQQILLLRKGFKNLIPLLATTGNKLSQKAVAISASGSTSQSQVSAQRPVPSPAVLVYQR